MKKTLYFFLLTIIMGMTLGSCQKEKKTNLDISGKIVNSTSCKNFIKKAGTGQIADSVSCVEYVFDPSRNLLILRHINAGFNCCPDDLYCTIQLRNDTILLREYEAAALCDCNCLYDLDIEITGVAPGKYQVLFMEPYVDDQEKLHFGIHLPEQTHGSFCVTRKQYPWGVTSITY